MTEKEIESQILDWLNLQHKVFAFKINTVGIFDPVRKVFRKNKNRHVHLGTSDIVGTIGGRFFAIEVKTPLSYKRFIKNPNDKDLLQIKFIERVRHSGGHGLVAYSLDQVIAWIKNLPRD